MINTLRMIVCSLSLALLLSACGGGGSTPPPPPTKAIVRLATNGTPPAGLNIGGLQTEISYAIEKGLSIVDNDVIASGKAAGATLVPNVTVPGKVSLGNFTLGAAGFIVGEFATLTFTIAPGNSPHASDFAVVLGSTIIGASDNATTDLSGQISVIIQSVTFQ